MVNNFRTLKFFPISPKTRPMKTIFGTFLTLAIAPLTANSAFLGFGGISNANSTYHLMDEHGVEAAKFASQDIQTVLLGENQAVIQTRYACVSVWKSDKNTGKTAKIVNEEPGSEFRVSQAFASVYTPKSFGQVFDQDGKKVWSGNFVRSIRVSNLGFAVISDLDQTVTYYNASGDAVFSAPRTESIRLSDTYLTGVNAWGETSLWAIDPNTQSFKALLMNQANAKVELSDTFASVLISSNGAPESMLYRGIKRIYWAKTASKINLGANYAYVRANEVGTLFSESGDVVRTDMSFFPVQFEMSGLVYLRMGGSLEVVSENGTSCVVSGDRVAGMSHMSQAWVVRNETLTEVDATEAGCGRSSESMSIAGLEVWGVGYNIAAFVSSITHNLQFIQAAHDPIHVSSIGLNSIGEVSSADPLHLDLPVDSRARNWN